MKVLVKWKNTVTPISNIQDLKGLFLHTLNQEVTGEFSLSKQGNRPSRSRRGKQNQQKGDQTWRRIIEPQDDVMGDPG